MLIELHFTFSNYLVLSVELTEDARCCYVVFHFEVYDCCKQRINKRTDAYFHEK